MGGDGGCGAAASGVVFPVNNDRKLGALDDAVAPVLVGELAPVETLRMLAASDAVIRDRTALWAGAATGLNEETI